MVIEPGAMPRESRAAERREAMAPSTMRAAGIPPIDVIVLDISATGVRLLTNAELSVGQEISIGLPGVGATRAYVAWCRDDQYGCVFERPIGQESAERAFAGGTVVTLGSGEAVTAPDGRDDLRDLYRHHRHQALPVDAVLGLLLAFALLGVGLWMVVRL